jgi:hypothetical protein
MRTAVRLWCVCQRADEHARGAARCVGACVASDCALLCSADAVARNRQTQLVRLARP